MSEQDCRVPGLLSVCIPVYKKTVVGTVRRMLAEIEKHALNVEVVVFDDYSDADTIRANAVLAEYEGVRYLPLLQNLGRSKIRNRLADFSHGEWLLFLDCDMEPIYSDFLQRYINAMAIHVDVVCGGVTFSKEPRSRDMILRWKHNRYWIRQRKRFVHRDPMMRLETGNFMIRHEKYAQCGFDESIEGYGQENKVFAYSLGRLSARIQYIDNPTMHLDDEDNEKFLDNIDRSTVNCIKVWNSKPDMRPSMLRGDKRLLFVVIMHRVGLLWLLNATFRLWRVALRRRLELGASWLSSLRYYQICTLAEAYVAPNIEALTLPNKWSETAKKRRFYRKHKIN